MSPVSNMQQSPLYAERIHLVVGGIVPAGLWIVRNHATFSVARLSTVEALEYVYFTGTGPYQLRHDTSQKEAQAMIAKEFGLAPMNFIFNHWISDRTVAEMDAELRAAVPGVLRKYPSYLVPSTLAGLIKASVSHNVGQLALMLGSDWTAPRTSALLRAKPKAVSRLLRNDPVLVFSFLWQVFHVLAFLGLAAVGILAVSKDHGSRVWSLLLLAILGYFYLTVAVVGLETYSRFRIPVLPFLYGFAGCGLARLPYRTPRRRGAVEMAEGSKDQR